MSEEDIKPTIFYLQESLKKNKNVKDGTLIYRGVDLKFQKEADIGIGSKFYFREFISTTIDKEIVKKIV